MDEILKTMRSSAPECLAFACGDVFMSAGPHVPDCTPPAPEYASTSAYSFATWLIEGAEPLYMIKADTHTLIYLPSTDMIYSADPQFNLHTSCPNNTVLRGQFILEKEEGGKGKARILVFDAIRINGAHMAGVDPQERYRQLQSCAQWFDGIHLVLQWCGNGTALLHAIKSKSFQVPHKIRSVVALTANPTVLERLE